MCSRGIVVTLQEMQIYTLDELLGYCNTFGVSRLREYKEGWQDGLPSAFGRDLLGTGG